MAEVENLINEPSEAEKRIKQLSDKVRTASEERDALSKDKEQALAEKAAAEKKAGFYKDFSKLSGKYSGAADHLEEIEAKVMSGYDPEDATVSVLNKAGKLNPTAESRPSPAGGSATTTLNNSMDKQVNEMSQQERRAALEERQAELADILAPKIGG